MHDIEKQWTAVLTLLGLISNVYGNPQHKRSNQRPQITEPKFYKLGNSSYRKQVSPI